MIIGIEGTGSQGWENDNLCRTFVRRILHATTLRPASYFIGPSNTGFDGQAIVNGAMDALLNGARSGPIVLVGYSRGAAYCLELCQRFVGTIDVLVMFDAVARQTDMKIPEKVPGNVALCYHAYRDPRAGSRYFFGNVGLTHASTSTKFEKKMFYGSHGAIGGTSYNAASDEGTVGNFVGNIVTTAVGAGADDRQHLNIAPYAMTSSAADAKAAAAVVEWIVPRLVKAGVVPSGNGQLHNAPPFTGSRLPGVRNMIR